MYWYCSDERHNLSGLREDSSRAWLGSLPDQSNRGPECHDFTYKTEVRTEVTLQRHTGRPFQNTFMTASSTSHRSRKKSIRPQPSSQYCVEVSQGSLLGPMPFTLHINDIPTSRSHNINIGIYGEDTVMHGASNKIQLSSADWQPSTSDARNGESK